MPANILVIEDEDELRAEILEYLLRRGHRVTGCANIEEAYLAVENVHDAESAPHMIVSDVRLPDGDGLSFYVANARRFPRTRWILMSGNHDLVRLGERLKNKADLPGCTVIDKPLPLRLLDRFVNDAIQGVFSARAA
jgi:DNA-binding NtrC family response regulator